MVTKITEYHVCLFIKQEHLKRLNNTVTCMYIESYNCDYDKLWMHLKYDILSWSTFCKLIQLYIYQVM